MNPLRVFSEEYVRIILALAPFVVCLAFSLDEWWDKRRGLAAISTGALFSASVWLPAFAVWGAFPWLILCSVRAVQAGREVMSGEERRTCDWAALAALLYLPVGGIWAVFDQLKFQPLGFSGIIVLLTGVHFHYAGFALPKLTALWLEKSGRSGVFGIAGWGVIMGVPLVAVGITTSQLAMPFWIETGAVSILAVAAFTISLGQLHWAFTESGSPLLARLLFGLGGVALAAGMVLATIYGWRHVYTVSWATIPAMYAIHGTLNSLGFCLPGFISWKLMGSK